MAVVAAIGGNPHEAEEAVQEAFVRLIGRWPAVERHRPYHQPPLASLAARSRRRRVVRRGAVAAAAVVAAVAVPAALLGVPAPPHEGGTPQWTVAPTTGAGPVPENATIVTACGGPTSTDCRTIADAAQVR